MLLWCHGTIELMFLIVFVFVFVVNMTFSKGVGQGWVLAFVEEAAVARTFVSIGLVLDDRLTPIPQQKLVQPSILVSTIHDDSPCSA